MVVLAIGLYNSVIYNLGNKLKRGRQSKCLTLKRGHNSIQFGVSIGGFPLAFGIHFSFYQNGQP